MTFPASDPIAVQPPEPLPSRSLESHEETPPHAIPNEGRTMAPDEKAANPSSGSYGYARHPLAVRIMHWINVLAVIVLLMSGLQIFNAHGALYWGQVLVLRPAPGPADHAEQSSDGDPIGVTRVFGHEFTTTGVLGISSEATVGSRRVHSRPGRRSPVRNGSPWGGAGTSSSPGCSSLNGASYVVYSIASGHLSRDLLPTRDRLALVWPIDFGSSAVSSPDGRGGATLQRAAEAYLPDS